MKIKNEADFKNADSKLQLSKISADEIEITDVDDVYDGPLSGSCFWNDDEYYFFTFDQLDDAGEEDRWPRKYLLIKTKPEQIVAIEKIRKAHQECQAEVITREDYSKFYDNSPEQIIEKDQIVGWFDDGGKASKFIGSYFIWAERRPDGCHAGV